MKKFNILALVFLIASWTSFAFAASGGPTGGSSGGGFSTTLGGATSYSYPITSTTVATYGFTGQLTGVGSVLLESMGVGKPVRAIIKVS